MTRPPHVAVLIETSRGYGRALLEGVARYNRLHGPWSLYFEPHGPNDPPPAWLRRWRGDGILLRVNDRRTADAVLASGVPAVDLRGRLSGVGLPVIGADNRAAADLAYGHLRDRGFRQFAFVGTRRNYHRHYDIRHDHFRELAQAGGFPCESFLGAAGRAEGWEEGQDRLAGWLHGLSKPVGVAACNDDRGQRVLDACRRAGVHVPEEVAVVGMDNDEIVCAMASPPMSSVDVNAARIGFEATALLARLMAQGAGWDRTGSVGVPPRGVVTRQSTDVLAVADKAVSSAVRFIRENAARGIDVGDVVAHTRASRAALDLRFKAALGRTPKAEILRVRLDRAKQLLTETNLSLDEVAELCGVRTAKYLGDVFFREVGVRPGEYRRCYQQLAEK